MELISFSLPPRRLSADLCCQTEMFCSFIFLVFLFPHSLVFHSLLSSRQRLSPCVCGCGRVLTWRYDRTHIRRRRRGRISIYLFVFSPALLHHHSLYILSQHTQLWAALSTGVTIELVCIDYRFPSMTWIGDQVNSNLQPCAWRARSYSSTRQLLASQIFFFFV